MGVPNLSKIGDDTTLTVEGFVLTKTGVEFPKGATLEAWERVGQTLQYLDGAVQWWIGDWLAKGAARWGEKYTQAVAETGLAYQTVATAKWVAEQVESSRRREDLPFAHHREVASLPAAQQVQLLAEAAPEKAGDEPRMTRSQLRKRVAQLREDEGKPFDAVKEQAAIQAYLEARREAWPPRRRRDFIPAVETVLERLAGEQ